MDPVLGGGVANLWSAGDFGFLTAGYKNWMFYDPQMQKLTVLSNIMTHSYKNR